MATAIYCAGQAFGSKLGPCRRVLVFKPVSTEIFTVETLESPSMT
jgi:hypothetical protein